MARTPLETRCVVAIEALEQEHKRLELEKANAEARAQLDALRAPPWRRGGVLAGLTAIVALIVPLTTGVQEYFRKEKEIALERERQTEQIRAGYLDRLKDPYERQRVLRFLIATAIDDRLRSWALDENKRITENAEKAEATSRDYAVLWKDLDNRLRQRAVADGKTLAKLAQARDELEKTRAALVSARKKLYEADDRCSAYPIRTATAYQECKRSCELAKPTPHSQPLSDAQSQIQLCVDNCAAAVDASRDVGCYTD